MREDWNRYGPDLPPAPTSQAIVLTQLQAQIEAMRLPLRADLSQAELAGLREASLRYGYSQLLTRAAVAAARTGNQDEAGLLLGRLCRTHPPRVCQIAQDQFRAAVGPLPG